MSHMHPSMHVTHQYAYWISMVSFFKRSSCGRTGIVRYSGGISCLSALRCSPLFEVGAREKDGRSICMSDLSAEAEKKSSAATATATSAAAPPPSTAPVPPKKKEEMRNESTGISVGDSTHTLADVRHTEHRWMDLWLMRVVCCRARRSTTRPNASSAMAPLVSSSRCVWTCQASDKGTETSLALFSCRRLWKKPERSWPLRKCCRTSASRCVWLAGCRLMTCCSHESVCRTESCRSCAS